MTRQFSSLCSQLNALQQQVQAVLEAFLRSQPLLPGSLYILKRRCGKANCRCVQGEPHVSTVLSYRGQGRPQNITPPPEGLEAVRKLTDEYRRFRQARTQLLRLQRQMLKLVDSIEAQRVQQGQREFQKMRAPSSRSGPRR
jgi:hypothetical protein